MHSRPSWATLSAAGVVVVIGGAVLVTGLSSPVRSGGPGGPLALTQSLTNASVHGSALTSVVQERAVQVAARESAARRSAARALAARRAARAAARRAAQKAAASAPAVSSAPSQPVVPAGAPQRTAAAMLPSFGWAPSQFSCLDPLWARESSWNPYATNPSSGAYGIPQALPGSKMASAGADWRTNPATQIRWGLGYIQATYGSPCAAWAHENAYGWY